MTAEILIVDDERTVRKALSILLRAEGFSVREARSGEAALAAFRERRADLVLLDVMMPGMNGYAVCRELRRLDDSVPVVFLTAKDDDTAELRGFDLGCDDYISKSASDELLLARIRHALRRAEPSESDVVVRLGGVEVDLRTREVSDRGSVLSRLTETELRILRVLAESRGTDFTVDDLVEVLRGKGYACEDTMIYSHVYHLRRKLGRASELLSCARFSGYRLEK